MNRYSPHYDHDEQRVSMGLDGEGSWVHIQSVDAKAVLELERQLAAVQAENERLRKVIPTIDRLIERLESEPHQVREGGTAEDTAYWERRNALKRNPG